MRWTALISTVMTVGAWAWPHPAPAQSCFKGHPAPRCRDFVVLEFTGAMRLNDKSGPTDQNNAFFYWSGGYLRNVGSTSALGAAFKLTADSDGHRYGPTARYRHWIGPSTSIDVAPGLYLGGEDNFVALRFPSPTIDVALNNDDLFGLAVGMDAMRADQGTDWQGHLGLRFGTWLAPIATLGLGVLLAATW